MQKHCKTVLHTLHSNQNAAVDKQTHLIQLQWCNHTVHCNYASTIKDGNVNIHKVPCLRPHSSCREPQKLQGPLTFGQDSMQPQGPQEKYLKEYFLQAQDFFCVIKKTEWATVFSLVVAIQHHVKPLHFGLGVARHILWEPWGRQRWHCISNRC